MCRFYILLLLALPAMLRAQLYVPAISSKHFDEVKSKEKLLVFFPDTLNGYPGKEYFEVVKSLWTWQPVEQVSRDVIDSLMFDDHNKKYNYVYPRLESALHMKDFSEQDEFYYEFGTIEMNMSTPFIRILCDMGTVTQGGGNMTPGLLRLYLASGLKLLDMDKTVRGDSKYIDTANIRKLDKAKISLGDFEYAYLPEKKQDKHVRELVMKDNFSEYSGTYEIVPLRDLNDKIEKNEASFVLLFITFNGKAYISVFDVQKKSLVYLSKSGNAFFMGSEIDRIVEAIKDNL